MIWHIGIPDNKTRVFLVSVIILSTMLLPSVFLHPSLPSIRLDECVLFGGWFYCFLVWLRGKVFKRGAAVEGSEKVSVDRSVKRIINTLFLLLVASFAISNIYGSCFAGSIFTFHDAMELVVFFKYYLVLSLVATLRLQSDEWKFLGGATLAGILGMVVIGWMQYWNLANFNSWMSGFLNPKHWDTLFNIRPLRILCSSDNPNDLAIFLVILIAIVTVRYFFAEKSNHSFPFFSLVLIALLIKLEYMTLSRTGIACLGLLLVICCLWALWRCGRNRQTFTRVGVLFLVTVALIFTGSGDFWWRIGEVVGFSENQSVIGRVERWNVAGESIKLSPLFGWGSQKGVATSVVDNEYMLYLRRYGAIGLTVYLTFFIVPWLTSVWALRNYDKNNGTGRKDPLTPALLPAAAYAILLPSILLFCMMAGIFYNLQGMTFLTVLMGLVYNSLNEAKDKDRTLDRSGV